MKGSLPPSSRFTRAMRAARALGDPRAGRDRAGEGDAVHALVVDRALAHLARARERFTTPAGRCSKQAASASVDSGVSSEGLRHGGVAGRQRGRELPGQQQQRVVPGHDAGHHAERLLDHERQLGASIGRDHAAGRRRGRARRSSRRRAAVQPTSSRFSSSGLPPSRVMSSASSSVRARSRAATSCSASARSAAGVAAQPGAASAAAAIAASICSARGERDGGDGSSRAGSSTTSARAVAGHQLAADQQPGLGSAWRAILRERLGPGLRALPARARGGRRPPARAAARRSSGRRKPVATSSGGIAASAASGRAGRPRPTWAAAARRPRSRRRSPPPGAPGAPTGRGPGTGCG